MYLDSAIFVKLFVREPDSMFYAERLDGQAGLWTSALAMCECYSALCRKEREKAIEARTRRAAWRRIEHCLSEGMLRCLPVGESVLKRSQLILERCHPVAGIRSLDAIHLASCEEIDGFPLWTNDSRMREAAELLRFPLGPVP
ncbi:MAG: type II toxin-antitoxin system VapC family toxin [Kiritimatiellia bacterium]